MATRCEALRVDFTNEQKYTQSILQPIVDLITDVKGDSEKMQQQIEQQINGLDSQLKSAEMERGALKKAHGEHMRCLEALHEETCHAFQAGQQIFRNSSQVDFTNEQKYNQGELQPIKDLIADMKGDSEKMQQQIQHQINGLDSQLKSAKEDQGAI